MKQSLASCLILLSALTVCSTSAAQPVEAGGRVVIIGVDGMSPDGIRQAATPHLDALMAGGAYSFTARAVLPSSSSPNWASMIMGAGPEQHGITSNDWERDSFLLEPTVAGPEGLFPTIFSVLRAAEPDAYIASIYDWGGFGQLFQKTTVDAAIDADGPQDAVSQARAQFSAHHPRLTFIHLDHVDHAGHTYGHGSDEYYASVEEADRLIGEVLAGLEDAGMAGRTLLLITADHGGRGKGHGGESMGEVQIPWIAYGAGVVAGKVLSVPIDTYDTAATVLFALGVDPPHAWIARPVRAAFARFHDTAESLGAYVPAPRIKPVSGFFRADPPTVTMTVDDPEAEIRYTLDGGEPTATSPRYERPIRITENAQVTARAFRQAEASILSEATYRVVPADQARNVRYAYYEGTWNTVPDFAQLQPVHTGSVYEFRVDGIDDKREDHFGVRFEATTAVAQAGEYTFYVTSDDGSKLYVDGVEVVDNDGGHGPLTRQGTLDLEAGAHQIVVAYFENDGGEFLEVLYAGPGVEKQLLSFDNAGPYLDDFYLPHNNPDSTERYYSFRWANAYFICLDTNIDYSPGSPQHTFFLKALTDSLRTSATWTFVYAHHPPYSEYWTDYYGEKGVQDHLVPLFEQYGVDMVMNDHTHSYERGEKGHVHYLISGGGGGGLDDYFTDYGHITFSDGVHHFTRIDVDDDELWMTAIDQDGQQVDRFLVNKFVDVSIKDDEFLHIPEAFEWSAPYPNPVRDTTTVVYRIAKGTQVRLELFDVLGRKISTLVDRHHFPDSYVVTLDATALAAGTYVLQLTAGAISESRQITVVR